jgi:tellurite resistance protein
VEVEDREKVVELIEQVIAADGIITDDEREFLRRVIERFGLSEEERADRVVQSDPGRATRTLRTFSPDDQARVMALLVDAAVADGKVEPEERALLLASAAALGIEACALEERIARRLKAVAAGLP